MQLSKFFPVPTVHREFWERDHCPFVYEYDPTDDGPECEAIKAILATHDAMDLAIEAL